MSERLTTILVLIALAAIATALWLQLEKVPVVRHGISTAQQQDAAIALLERRNKTARRITSSSELFPLPDSDTLIILERHQPTMPEWQLQALTDWVLAGGRLLTHARPLDLEDWNDGSLEGEDLRNQDPLLYRFGVTAWYESGLPKRLPGAFRNETAADVLAVEFSNNCLTDSNAKACLDLTCGDSTKDVEFALLYLDDQQRLLQLELNPAIDLLHRDLYDEFDENDASLPEGLGRVADRAMLGGHDVLLKLRAGDGELWLLSDLDIFGNARLHHLDHADLLVTLSDDRQQVWWAVSVDVPPLSAWLWQRGWPLIIALLLLLLVFLWLHMPRRGVVLQTTNNVHHNFTDHLRAASALLWRIGQRDAVLSALRRKVLQALARHPGGDDPNRRDDVAGMLSGLDAALVRRALTDTPDDDAALLQLVALLQHLRRSL
jgi:hypothetical protein